MRREFCQIAQDAEDPDQAALAAIATCVGGILLGRALADDELVEKLLGACRETVARELSEICLCLISVLRVRRVSATSSAAP